MLNREDFLKFSFVIHLLLGLFGDESCQQLYQWRLGRGFKSTSGKG